MSVSFRPAERGNLGLVLMLAGGTGSGKTYSALTLAKGMANGRPFAVCDTERGRASMYADTFAFDVFELDAPFSPDRYLEVVQATEQKDYPVLVIDSMSHEWEGPGGLLDWHEREMKGQEARNLTAWIKPKMAHRKFVNQLLQARPHIIMCFRAAERVEAVRGDDGKMKVVPKKSLTGLDGWLPITERHLPFEATASFMFMADKPGVPRPIKLPEPLKPFVPLDQPLSEDTGRLLAQWAAGDGAVSPAEPQGEEIPQLAARLLDLAGELGKRDATSERVTKHRQQHTPAEHERWLRAQVDRARDAVVELEKATQILSGQENET